MNLYLHMSCNGEWLDMIHDIYEITTPTIKSGCQYCGTTTTTNDKGDNICTNEFCSAIQDNRLDSSDYTNGAVMGTVKRYHNGNTNLGTTIAGNPFTGIGKVHSWGLCDYKERRQAHVFKELERTGKKNKISGSVIDTAKNIYEKMNIQRYSDKLENNRKRLHNNSIIGALLLTASHLQHKPFTIVQIKDMCEIDSKQLSTGTKVLREFLSNDDIYSLLGSSQSADYTREFCEKLGLDKKQTDTAILIANTTDHAYLVQNAQPTSIAVVSIILMADIEGLEINRNMLSKTFDISNVTINTIHKVLWQYIKIISNKDIAKNVVMDIQAQHLQDTCMC
jgi:transcription initiation factor TFIIIB Brf1 subunit/transcription initiation factor TFIIB